MRPTAMMTDDGISILWELNWQIKKARPNDCKRIEHAVLLDISPYKYMYYNYVL